MSASDLEDVLRERLDALAESGGPRPAALAGDLADDLERGHAALRRRGALRAGLAGLTVAAVTGTALALAPGGPTTRAVPPAADGASTAPSASASPTAAEPSHPAADKAERAAREEARKQARDAWITARLERHSGTNPFKDWRDGLFAISRDVLDPGGRHLDYATDSLQSGYGSAGVSLGIKLGWSNPGEPGQGMVMVAVSDGEPTGEGDPCFSIGINCMREGTFRGVPVRRSDDGRTVVAIRPDGLVVMVHVEDLFGNDASVGVSRLPLTEADLSTLALDPRIDLPAPGRAG